VHFLHSAAQGTTLLAIRTIVAGILPRERYGEGMGWFTLGQTLSTATGPFSSKCRQTTLFVGVDTEMRQGLAEHIEVEELPSRLPSLVRRHGRPCKVWYLDRFSRHVLPPQSPGTGVGLKLIDMRWA